MTAPPEKPLARNAWSPPRTAPYARYLVRLTRPFPNFDLVFMRPLRQKAVRLLHLKHGDHVLDMGCGMGASFPYLVDAVGPSGEVVGVEISPEVTINTSQRIERNRWRNVQVIEAAAQTVRLTGTFDGLLMFAAPDVYSSQEALENIFPRLRENARVVVFGVKMSSDGFGRILSPLLRVVVSKFSFPTTPSPDHEPWRLLAKRLEGFEIEEYFFGLMFLASGSATRARKKP
jgi:ubiquinone/menaquinone biosynthesis C-methylase UbiE